MNDLARLSKQQGFTLVEVMVSVVISLIITAGVFQIFLSNKQSYRSNTALAHLQESGRIGIHILSSAIRAAGYQGCADPNTVGATTLANDPPTATLFQNTLRGYEINGPVAWAPNDLLDIQDLATITSDVISVQHGSNNSTPLASSMSAANAPINIADDRLNISAGEIVLIADCDSADLFRVSGLSSKADGSIELEHGIDKNNSDALNKAYTTRASVMRFRSDTYFVADTGRSNAVGDTTSALFRRDASGEIVELVEGVESMQILYGEFNDSNNLTRYVPANAVDLDLGKVTSVRIALLIHSIEPVLDQNNQRSYTLAGTQIDPAGTIEATHTYPVDRRMRRTFSASIKLRNRS